MQKTRIQSIDGLRGCAAVTVILYHAILHYDSRLVNDVIDAPVMTLATAAGVSSKVILTLFNGEYAVILFFLISGFVLQRSFDRFGKLDLSTACEFFIRRACRLMPSIFVSVTVIYLLLVIGDPLTNITGDRTLPSFRQYFSNLFLIDTDLLSVTWTIRVEMLAVPFIFVVLLLGRVVGLAGTLAAVVYSLYALQNPLLTGSVFMLHSALLPFSVGALAASSRLAIRTSRPAVPAAICLFAFTFSRFMVYPAQIVALISQIALGGILLNILANYSDNALNDVLQGKVFQFLGKISYSLYLYAEIVGIYVTFAISFFSKPAQTMAVPFGLLVGVVICVVTIPIAALAEKFVERPGNWIGARLASSLSHSSRSIKAKIACLL